MEPNLAELKKEMKDITEKCERLQHKLSRIFTKPVLEGTSEAGVAVKEFETLQEGMQGLCPALSSSLSSSPSPK